MRELPAADERGVEERAGRVDVEQRGREGLAGVRDRARGEAVAVHEPLGQQLEEVTIQARQ